MPRTIESKLTLFGFQVPGQKHQQPVLMISDSTTRLLAGRFLRGGERTDEFIKQLERAWIRHFGPMQVLQVDEHRAWSSDPMREWCTEQGIQLQVSPGQAHTRLAILERRHQVTRRAVTLFLQANPSLAEDPDARLHAARPWSPDGGADWLQPGPSGPFDAVPREGTTTTRSSKGNSPS